MEFLPEVQNVLKFLDHYSGGKLRKAGDVGGLLDIAARQEWAERMNELIFVGSALWKVYRALRRSETAGYPVERLEQELYALAARMRMQLQTLIETEQAPTAFANRCQQIYFDAPGALRNLLDLAHDFHWLHQLQQEMRRQSTDERS